MKKLNLNLSSLIIIIFFYISFSYSDENNTIKGKAIVVDGDTIKIKGKQIRFGGIDAPESYYRGKKQTCIDDNKKVWESFYKPEHVKNAAQCSKCNLYYWQIEKKLFDINIISPDIFYQTYDTKGSGGKMVCRLCDPEAFKKNKE